MFFERLTSLFFEHAAVFRAMTVDEYNSRVSNMEFHYMEYYKICMHWDKAVTDIDLNSPAYTVDIFTLLSAFGYSRADNSSWEVAVRNE